LGVHALGERDRLGEDRDLLVDTGPGPEDDVDQLFEIEQPERQLQIARIEDLGMVAEAASVFVVAIEQKDAEFRSRVHDLLQDQCDAARLADAGGTQDRKVLGEHFVDGDIGTDGRVLVQCPDVDRIGAGDVIDEAQLAARHQSRGVANRRVVCHPTLEPGLTGVGIEDLAKQVEPRAGVVTLLATRGRHLDRHLGNHADEKRLTAPDAEELAHGRRRVHKIFQILIGQANLSCGAVDGKDARRLLREDGGLVVRTRQGVGVEHGSLGGGKREPRTSGGIGQPNGATLMLR
jgi:hypothetical protein